MTAGIMHPSLIYIINEAAKYSDVIVGLLTDKVVTEHKRFPYLTYEQRKKVVENIKGVSEVVPQEGWSYADNLKRIKPDYIIHDDDWKTGPLREIREQVFEIMNEQGGEVVEVPYTKGINSFPLGKEIKSIGTTPGVRLKTLRRLINAKPTVRVLEAHDGLYGPIIENLEIQGGGKCEVFDGMWSSSLTDSTSRDKPDTEAVGLTARSQDLNNILECTTKPTIFDGNTGGKIEHFVFTVRALRRHGISAVIIEDKMGSKKNSSFSTDAIQTQDIIKGFCAKIRAGKEAQVTQDFIIITRIESLTAGKPISGALEHAHTYVEAGVDGIMIHSKNKSGEDIKEFCLTFRQRYTHVPIVVVPTTYDHVHESELYEWGMNVVIYANHTLRVAYPVMMWVACTILENKRAQEVRGLCVPIKKTLELIPGTKQCIYSMLNVEEVFNLFLTHDIDFFTGVPDSLLKDICAYITDHAPASKHIIAANEGTAVDIAAGYYMTSDKLPLVYMQNSGLGNTVNPLLSLADEKVYSLPILLMIGWCGEPGTKDEPQHKKQGEIILDLPGAIKIPYIILDMDEDEALTQIHEVVVSAYEKSVPHAIMVYKDTFDKYKLQKKQNNAYPSSREGALKLVINHLHETDTVVSTTGKLSRELFEYREVKRHGHSRDFLIVGSMGHSSSIALGITLKHSERKIYCLNGDGTFIVHMGAVSNIDSLSPAGYFHTLFNNDVHESVRGQPTLGFQLDIPAAAKTCGYRHTSSVTSESEIQEALQHLQPLDGPILLELKVRVDSRTDLGRPTTTTPKSKECFIEFLSHYE